MTQLHTTVPHRDGQQTFEKASFEKAQALGENAALAVLQALRDPGAVPSVNTEVAVAGRSFLISSRAVQLGHSRGGHSSGWYWGKGRTEVHAIQIGDLAILTVPGELYRRSPRAASNALMARLSRRHPRNAAAPAGHAGQGQHDV